KAARSLVHRLSNAIADRHSNGLLRLPGRSLLLTLSDGRSLVARPLLIDSDPASMVRLILQIVIVNPSLVKRHAQASIRPGNPRLPVGRGARRGRKNRLDDDGAILLSRI